MVVSLMIVLVFAGCMLAASWSDLTSMTIPNWISLVLLAGFFAIAPLTIHSWSVFGEHLAVGLVCFIAGIVMFALGWMGGGDAKLLAATSIWFVWADLPYYLVYTALSGGGLAVLIMMGRAWFPATVLTTDWMHRLFKDEKKMPYGLALAFGALMTLPKSQIFLSAFGLG